MIEAYGKFYIEEPADMSTPDVDLCLQCDYFRNKGFSLGECEELCSSNEPTILKEVSYKLEVL